MPIDRIPLDPRRLLLHIDARDADELLDRLCAALATAEGLDVDAAQLRALADARLAERDCMAAGDFACLMLRVEGLPGLRISVATLNQTIPWGADGTPVVAVGILAMPHDNPAPGLRLYEQLVELARRPDARRHIAGSRSAPDLARWLERYLNEDDGPLLASEIMRAPYHLILPDTPLSEVTHLLVAYNLDAAAIVDAQGVLLGEVTADTVFTLGMPEFFRQLKSVSFIAELDPLERFFQLKDGLTARDVMHDPVAKVPPTSTLLEVLFLLSVQGHPKVYVVDEAGTLLGIVDRIRVLDRIINL